MASFSKQGSTLTFSEQLSLCCRGLHRTLVLTEVLNRVEHTLWCKMITHMAAESSWRNRVCSTDTHGAASRKPDTPYHLKREREWQTERGKHSKSKHTSYPVYVWHRQLKMVLAPFLFWIQNNLVIGQGLIMMGSISKLYKIHKLYLSVDTNEKTQM